MNYGERTERWNIHHDTVTIRCDVGDNNILTECSSVQRGLKHGCLFSTANPPVYTNDLIEELRSSRMRINIDSLNICSLLYTDDVLLIAPSALN